MSTPPVLSMRELWESVRSITAEQAEDGGLWFVADSVVEAYLQQELRRLTAVVEAAALAGIALLDAADDLLDDIRLESGSENFSGVRRQIEAIKALDALFGVPSLIPDPASQPPTGSET